MNIVFIWNLTSGGGVAIDQQSSFSNLLFNRKPKSFIGFISHFFIL